MADNQDTDAEGMPTALMELMAPLLSVGGGSLTISFYPADKGAATEFPEVDCRREDYGAGDDYIPAAGFVRAFRGPDLSGANIKGEGLQDGMPLPKFVLDSAVTARATSGSEFSHYGAVIAFTRYRDRESAYLVRFPAQRGLPEAVERWRDESELDHLTT